MTTKYALHPKLAYRAIAGELFVVSEEGAFHHAHLPTAVDILSSLRDTPQSTEELVALITKKYNVETATAGQDVKEFLEMLQTRKIVVTTKSE